MLTLVLASHPGQGLRPEKFCVIDHPSGCRIHGHVLRLCPAADAVTVRVTRVYGGSTFIWEEAGMGLQNDCGLETDKTLITLVKSGPNDRELLPRQVPVNLCPDGTIEFSRAPHMVLGMGVAKRPYKSPPKGEMLILVPRGDRRMLVFTPVTTAKRLCVPQSQIDQVAEPHIDAAQHHHSEDDATMAMLMDMGFPADRATEAAQLHKTDFEAALAYCTDYDALAAAQAEMEDEDSSDDDGSDAGAGAGAGGAGGMQHSNLLHRNIRYAASLSISSSFTSPSALKSNSISSIAPEHHQDDHQGVALFPPG
jgi:hypothetical protein